MKNETILIVGGGVAGLMVKNRLEALGFTSILAEKSETLRADGAGLLLGANVLKIFKAIGLETQLLSKAQIIKMFCILDERGAVLGKLDFDKLYQKSGYRTVAVHRQDLHDLISSSVDQESIWFSHKLNSIIKRENGYEVAFENGRVALFDRVIGADGLFSKVKEDLFGDMTLRHTRQACWRFVMDAPEELNLNTGCEMWGDGKRIGIFPIGQGKIYIFLVANLSGKEASWDIEQVLAHFEGFGGEWPKIRAAVETDSTKLLFGELADAKHLTLEKDGVVLIGDAAHSTTPNMGQGAAMGIESAYIFAELLKEHGFDDAILLYAAKRHNKVHKIREQSMMVGKLAHVKSKPVQKLRNFLMKLTPKSISQKQFERAVFDG